MCFLNTVFIIWQGGVRDGHVMFIDVREATFQISTFVLFSRKILSKEKICSF